MEPCTTGMQLKQVSFVLQADMCPQIRYGWLKFLCREAQEMKMVYSGILRPQAFTGLLLNVLKRRHTTQVFKRMEAK